MSGLEAEVQLLRDELELVSQQNVQLINRCTSIDSQCKQDEVLRYITKHPGLTSAEISEDLGRNVKAELIALAEAGKAKKTTDRNLILWSAK